MSRDIIHWEDINKVKFELSEVEILALHDYFYRRAGFISYEFDALVLKLIKRLDEYVKEM